VTRIGAPRVIRPRLLHTDGVSDDPAGPAPVYAARRVAYAVGSLEEEGLAASPLGQFERWYADAVDAGLPEPNATVLGTAGVDGTPSGRTVLLKQADARGFVVYTNLLSRKGRELAATPRASLTFPWYPMQRQVCVRGGVEPVPREESAAYFSSRPWASRIGAWVSRQSEPVRSRAELDERWQVLAARWPDTGSPDDVPLPDHWGGVLVRPTEVEFWQGRPSRLHDRLVFLPTDAAAGWTGLDDPVGWRVVRRQP